MIAPIAAPPPTFVAVLLVCDCPLSTYGSTVTFATAFPYRIVFSDSWSSPELLIRPDGVALRTRPLTSAPRGMITRFVFGSVTSVVTVPVNFSPCCAVSDERLSFTRTSIGVPDGSVTRDPVVARVVGVVAVRVVGLCFDVGAVGDVVEVWAAKTPENAAAARRMRILAITVCPNPDSLG
jgi:hypothetical protein